MRIIFRSILSIITFILLNINATESVAQKPNPGNTSNQSRGFEFYVVITPGTVSDYWNGYSKYDFDKMISISSEAETDVEIYRGTTVIQKYKLYPNQAQQYWFRDGNNDPLPRVLRIVSKTNPISVYDTPSDSKDYDGSMVIPVKSWGTKYIHNCFWTGDLNDKTKTYFNTGFVVVASEDSTIITIELKSTAGNEPSNGILTDDNTYPGGHNYFILMKGESRFVRTNTSPKTSSGDLNIYDISGTTITSNKPVGVVATHLNASVPNILDKTPTLKNLMVEMLLPTSLWGRTFYAKSFRKDTTLGDYLRIITEDKNNEYSVEWYNDNTGKLIGSNRGVIADSNGIAEIPQLVPTLDLNNTHYFKGNCVIKTTKPAQVYQYYRNSTSKLRCGPFMLTVPSREQFVKGAQFQTTRISTRKRTEMTQHNLQLFAVGDTMNPVNNEKLLSSFKISKDIDGIKATQFLPLEEFIKYKPFVSRIPNTDVYAVNIDLMPGSYIIKADAMFAGSYYGYRRDIINCELVDYCKSFGWPIAMNAARLGEIDTIPPQVTINGECGDHTAHFTELVKGSPSDSIIQNDSGVEFLPQLLAGSYNYALKFQNNPVVLTPPQKDYSFNVEVIDKYSNALAYIEITDLFDNRSTDTIKYFPEVIGLDSGKVIDLGSVILNNTKTLSFKLKNIGNITAGIKKVYLKNKTEFHLVSGEKLDDSTIVKLNIGETYNFQVSYLLNAQDSISSDTLVIVTKCDLVYYVPVTGTTKYPIINVSDFLAGDLNVKEIVYSDYDLYIENIGNAPLVLNGGLLVDNNQYFADSIINFTYPVTINPGKRLIFKYGIFRPLKVGEYHTQMIFSSNALAGDSISDWTGRALKKGLDIINCDWRIRRVLTDNDSIIYIVNNSTAPIKIESLRFENGSTISDDSCFVITNSIEGATLKAEGPMFDSLRKGFISIKFTPKYEFDKYAKVIVKYNHGYDSLISYLHGYGALPKIKFSGYVFGKILDLSAKESDTAKNGESFIKSISSSAKLHIKRATILTDLGQPDDFTINYNGVNLFSVPYSGYLDRIDSINNLLNFDLHFSPQATSKRFLAIEILHDAVPGNGYIPWEYKLDTIYIVGFAKDRALPIDFGSILACGDRIKSFIIKNGSTDDYLNLDTVFVKNYNDVFSIITPQNNLTIAPSSEYSILVKFSPNNRPELSDFESKIFANTTYRDSKIPMNFEESLKGSSYKNNIEIRLPVLNDMVAGETTNGNKSFAILCKNLNPDEKWINYKINSLEIKIAYESATMKYDGSDTLLPGEALSGWNLNAKEEINSDGTAILTIIGSGNFIENDGKLFSPIFTMLLSDKSTFENKIISASVNTGSCVEIQTVPGKINFGACVQNLRNIKLSTSEYGIKPVTPTPIQSGSFYIDFSIGLDASYTKIELFSYAGELVKVLYDGESNSGEYRMTVNSSDLASGNYIIKMTSGPYEKKVGIVIEK